MQGLSYEWYNLSKEDSPTRVLLDEYKKILCPNSEQCHQCQIHGNLNHLPPIVLNSLSSPWPFAAWGIDIMGEIRPNASNGHKYIVVVIDYFSRWIEADSFGTLKAKQMAKFIEKSFICRYGVPHHV